MKSLVRCKACGFIMDAGKVEDVCPACGVPSKMFEAFTDNISENRKRILDRHIHPVIVHAPQAFASFILLFSLGLLVVSPPIRDELFAAIRVLAVCLPFTVAAAFFSGLLDGKTRFRRYTTPILKKKIVLAIVFFVCSLALLPLSQGTYGQEGTLPVVLLIAVSAMAVVCSTFLGLYGASLLQARFPG